ncbi:MAG TPA: CapA family protein [Candidatus Nanopelagicales bacterium]|nr:CapA family protein [Candidatus Nanopelagicales bacterium]
MPPRQPPRRPPMARPLSGSTAPRGSAPRGSRGGRSPLPATGITVALLAVVGVALLVGAAVFAGASPGSPASPDPGASGAAVASVSPAAGGQPGGASPNPSSPAASAGPSPQPGSGELPLALVADVRDLRESLTVAQLKKELAAGRVALPCGLAELSLDAVPVTYDAGACVDAAKITAAVRSAKPRLGLLPAALVTPRVKVLRIGNADLFGAPRFRSNPYPLIARAAKAPAAWAGFDPAEVRTIISTGETCPDRGVSYWANTKKKGWDWVLDGGTARYTGIGIDRRFDGPDGNGWPVVKAVRSGNEGAVRTLISDAELTIGDFECPMTSDFVQHDTGTVFSIDPKVAPLLARSGIDVVTLASNHITDQGIDALQETMDLLDDAGVRWFGAGMNLAQARKPAVIDVRGVRFAFVGFNEIPGSRKAGPTAAGVTWLTETNVRAAVAAARKVADVVIVVPQWAWPEYHAEFTARQEEQMQLFWDAGADHVVGHGTHWSSAISITKGDRGSRVAISSHGNFLFGQDWSRQTQEGVLPELTFVGTRLVQVRLHPYIVMDQAQPNLITPTTDGKHVLNQVWSVSQLP